MKKLIPSVLSAVIAFSSVTAVCASAESRISGQYGNTAEVTVISIDAEMQRYASDSATIPDGYVPDSLVRAAEVTLSKEAFEELTSNPGSYTLKYIDSKPVACRDKIVIGLNVVDAATLDPTIALTLPTGIEVLKRLDAVFFAANTRNAILDEINAAIDGEFDETTTAATTTVTTTATTTTTSGNTTPDTTTSSAETSTTSQATTTTSSAETTTTSQATTTTSNAETTTTSQATTTTSNAETTTTSQATTTTSTAETTTTSQATTTTSSAATTTTSQATTTTTSTAATTTTSQATTTTSTAATTTTLQVTTTASGTATTTQPETNELGDIDGNGIVDAVDASSVLAYYARISTNQDEGYTESQKKAADVNKDGQVNAVDASNILAYYAYASTAEGKVKTLAEFLNGADSDEQADAQNVTVPDSDPTKPIELPVIPLS